LRIRVVHIGEHTAASIGGCYTRTVRIEEHPLVRICDHYRIGSLADCRESGEAVEAKSASSLRIHIGDTDKVVSCTDPQNHIGNGIWRCVKEPCADLNEAVVATERKGVL
jgi:hypothetical protein